MKKIFLKKFTQNIKVHYIKYKKNRKVSEKASSFIKTCVGEKNLTPNCWCGCVGIKGTGDDFTLSSQ